MNWICVIESPTQEDLVKQLKTLAEEWDKRLNESRYIGNEPVGVIGASDYFVWSPDALSDGILIEKTMTGLRVTHIRKPQSKGVF